MRNAKTLFTKMSASEKILMVGAGLTILSLFLPWYRDLDAWGKGDTFLGITGPLSVIGLIILIGSGAVFGKMLGRMLHKRVAVLEKYPDMPKFVTVENFILFVITASIYFDPQFGVNITLKQTSFGLFLHFIGTSIMAFGIYMSGREPEKLEMNVFEEVEESIDRIHQDIARRNPNYRETADDVPLAERQYRETHAEQKNETLKLDI